MSRNILEFLIAARDGTVEVIVPSVLRFLVVMSHKCPNRYVYVFPGLKYNCYFISFDSISNARGTVGLRSVAKGFVTALKDVKCVTGTYNLLSKTLLTPTSLMDLS